MNLKIAKINITFIFLMLCLYELTDHTVNAHRNASEIHPEKNKVGFNKTVLVVDEEEVNGLGLNGTICNFSSRSPCSPFEQMVCSLGCAARCILRGCMTGFCNNNCNCMCICG